MRLRALAALFVLAAAAPLSAGRVDLARRSLALDGAPAAMFAVDADRDGRRDLALVVVGASWGQIGVDERTEVDELGTYVEVLTIVPALLDRRVLALHRGTADGFAAEPLRLELPDTVHALFAGPASAPLLAWTDDGVAAVEVRAAAEEGAGEELALVPRIAARSPLAGSRSLLAGLPRLADVDGDGEGDLLLPALEGSEAHLVVHLANASGFSPEPAARFAVPLEERLPGDASHYRRGPRRSLPLPEPIDLDGDRLPELLFRNHDVGWNEIRALPNLGGGRFGAPYDPLAGRTRDAEPEIVWVGELDGRPGAELITEEELEPEKESMRAELDQARRPRMRYRLHGFDAQGRLEPEPRRLFELEGHVFGGGDDDEIRLPIGVRDLDADGRGDLVAMTLDFSLLQAVRIAAARSISLGLDFVPHCQQADGGFVARPDPELAGRFTLRLDRLRLPRLVSFAGDFDADGLGDFLQIGRGRRATIRFGEAGCRYSRSEVARVELAAEPADLALVRVDDLDGDGASDLAVTFPPPPGAIDGRGRLDLYLSGGAR